MNPTGSIKFLISPSTGIVELVEAPTPVIGPGELLVRMLACGICGTDLNKVHSPGVTRPFQLGHEVVATVVEVGAGAERFAVGQRVAIAHHVPDYGSHYSRRGSAPMGEQFKRSNIDPGGFAELIRVPASHIGHTVLPVPADIPDLRAVFMEPLACCLRALDRVSVLEGDTVLVVGLGAAGLLFVPLLRDRSATVLASDVRPERLDLARQWGASRGLLAPQDDVVSVCRQQSDDRGADLVILTVVNQPILSQALDALRDGGSLLLFGVQPETIAQVDIHRVWRREINLISSYSTTPDVLPRAMAILGKNGYALEQTVSHTFGLTEALTAFALAQRGEASKVVITGRN